MKNFKRLIAGSICTLGCVTSVYAANPASIEYVNIQIQNLQTTLQTQISNLPAGTIYTAGSGIGITGSVISNTSPGITYTAGTGIGIAGGVISNTSPGITYTAGSGISIAGSVISATGASGHFVGEFYQGGVIYWLDPSASPAIHGLIADIADQSGTFQWSVASTTTGATLNGAYQGKNSGTFNTAKILATPGTTYPAASACATSSAQGFADWYLPSLQELAMMFVNQMAITNTALANSGGAFVDINTSPTQYWSSTESSAANAWYFYFDNGNQGTYNKTGGLRVRCVRAF